MSDFSINNLNLKNSLNVVDVDGNLIDTMTVSELLKAKLLKSFAGLAIQLQTCPRVRPGSAHW